MKAQDTIKRDKFLWKADRDNYLKWFPRLKKVLAYQKGVRVSDIELLLFIYDISFFSLGDILDNGIVSTPQTLKQHIQRLKTAQLLSVYENASPHRGICTKYRISQTGKFLVTRLYRILSGKEGWPAE
jgi:hypothetical protein